MALPGIRAAPEEDGPGGLDETRPVKRPDDAAERGRVARDDAHEVAPDRVGVVERGDEREAGEGVLLATLEDRLASGGDVTVPVQAGDLLRRAVDDDVALGDQVVERPGRRHAGLAHRCDGVVGRAVERDPELDRGLNPVIGDDVGDADEDHVVLQPDGVGDALADDAVAIDGDADS